MAEKLAKIIVVVAAIVLLTLLSLIAFVAISGASSEMVEIEAAFIIIEFTVITGIITICCQIRKVAKKVSEDETDKSAQTIQE